MTTWEYRVLTVEARPVPLVPPEGATAPVGDLTPMWSQRATTPLRVYAADNDDSWDSIVEALAACGAEGWELVGRYAGQTSTSIPAYFFKRPIE